MARGDGGGRGRSGRGNRADGAPIRHEPVGALSPAQQAATGVVAPTAALKEQPPFLQPDPAAELRRINPNIFDPAAEGHWVANPDPLNFSNVIDPAFGPVVDVDFRATYQTVLFDLRASFMGSDGYQPEAQAIQPGALFGTQFNLFLEISGLTPGVAIGMRWYFFETGAVLNPDDAAFQSDRVDITASVLSFNALAGRSSLRFTPIGPQRYWAVTLVVDLLTPFAAGAVPSLLVSGALH